MLKEILDYVEKIGGVIFYEQKVYSPKFDEIIDLMKSSNANKFCQNSIKYLMEWKEAKMYNIGYCKICKQGLLEIAKDKLTKKIFICCDECEAEWDNSEDALKGINGTRNKHGEIEYPNIEYRRYTKRKMECFNK